jgi:ribosomal protein L37AE/L43A
MRPVPAATDRGDTSVSDPPKACPQCGSADIRYRESRGDWFCDDCHQRWTVAAPAGERPAQKARLFLSYGRRDDKTLAEGLGESARIRPDKSWWGWWAR